MCEFFASLTDAQLRSFANDIKQEFFRRQLSCDGLPGLNEQEITLLEQDRCKNKIGVIKLYKSRVNCSLLEAKRKVENTVL